VSHIADELGFECYQMENGIWMKRRPDGRRGPCVADEAKLWQALQAATGGKPQPAVDVAELIKENERLSKDCERMTSEAVTVGGRLAQAERMLREGQQIVQMLQAENAALRANQRQKPGRKPRPRSDAGPAGGPEAGAATEHEDDLLDEDL
jgi:hypothetical protein